MLSCREVSERASDLIDGRASWRVRTEARLHLLMCRHCRRYVRQLRLTVQALRSTGRSEPPVDAQSVLDAIDRAQHKPDL
jgi:hypothetical protein